MTAKHVTARRFAFDLAHFQIQTLQKSVIKASIPPQPALDESEFGNALDDARRFELPLMKHYFFCLTNIQTQLIARRSRLSIGDCRSVILETWTLRTHF